MFPPSSRTLSRSLQLLALTLLGWWVQIALPSHAAAQPTPSSPDWAPYLFLIGQWSGEGSGEPGMATGGFSFSLDLQNAVLVRKSWADYPATQERPAFRHDDLMIIYQGADKAAQADYYDNERHVIHYDVQLSSDSSSLVFTSRPVASSPRFRFTYVRQSNDRLTISFEIAPPGKPDAFSPYIQASARRSS